MTSSKPIIAFDFDGVISNSVHDSYVTALNAYMEFLPEHQLPLTERIDPAEKIFEYEKENPELFDKFMHLLPMGNRAEDYYVILQAIERDLSETINSQDSFDRFKADLDPSKRAQFHDFFYHFRIHRQDEDPVAWARLLPSFPGIPEIIPTLAESFTLGIATAKDGRSVDLQLANYGLSEYFDCQNRLDKDFSETKRGHLRQFHAMHGTPYSDIHFIDDKVLHLLAVEDLGVKCYLSMWGFNSKREHDIAREHGFTLLEIDGLRHFNQFSRQNTLN